MTDPDGLTCSPVDFTAVTVDGSPLGSEHPVKVTGSDPDIIVSPVTGSAFSVTWVTAQPMPGISQRGGRVSVRPPRADVRQD